MKISGAVVLYNPNIVEVVANIITYVEPLNVLYVFDNSDNGNCNKDELERKFTNIKYYSFNENRGIAFALNYILKIAYESKSEWILTMDQDSSFHSGDIQLYFNLIESQMDSKIVLFSPIYPEESLSYPQFYTSGSVMNLQAWIDIGKFDENLFIDEVDGDYTFRLKEKGSNLKKINEIRLNHKLGDKYGRKVLNKILYSDNHPALRKYYIARNRIYLMKKRPAMRRIYFCDSFHKFILFILIESDKFSKLLMIFRGVYDGITNRMGKFRDT